MLVYAFKLQAEPILTAIVFALCYLNEVACPPQISFWSLGIAFVEWS